MADLGWMYTVNVLHGFDGVFAFFPKAFLYENFIPFDYLYGFTVYVYILKNIFALSTRFADQTNVDNAVYM